MTIWTWISSIQKYLKKIFFNWRIIALQLLCWFLPNNTVNQRKYTRVPSLEPPSHFQPHPTALGCHKAPPGSLGYTATSQELSALHVVVYMLQFYSLNSSHPLPPLCVQKSVLHACVSISAMQIGSSLSFL